MHITQSILSDLTLKNKYYVYFHISKKDGRVFYVGKGTGNRCLSKYDRNFYWKKIVNEEGYICEIVKFTESEEEAYLEEIKLIKEIGRADLGLGTLINLTDGGDGGLGLKWNGRRAGKNNPMYGKKQSDAMKNKLRCDRVGVERPEHIKKILKQNSKKSRSIYLDEFTGIYYEGINELQQTLSIPKSTLFLYLKNNKLKNIKKV